LPSPRYYQVYVTLREWVRDGVYASGAQIPTEAQLCETFGVSRITVRKAIEKLVDEGWLVRRQGKGTFVEMSAAHGAVALDLNEVLSHVEHLGRTTRVRAHEVSEVVPDDETRAALGLGREERVQKAVHVRELRGQALGRITTFVPLDIAARVTTRRSGTTPMLALLEKHGIEVASAEQHIGATLANLEVARALDVAAGAPLLRITRVVFDGSGRAVERVIALYRADAYHYRMQLSRSKTRRPRWLTE
jgi:GntR family transcriptional regulator